MNSIERLAPLRVSWLTNVPAPYRVPIWDHLAKSVQLHVYFLLKEDNWRSWTLSGTPSWNWTYLSKFSVRIREFDFVPGIYGTRRILKQTDLVVVGGWESTSYFLTIMRAKRARIPVILFYESTLQSRRFNGRIVRFIRSHIFLLADYVVTSGVASTKATIEIGVDPAKILTLFNPVDVRFFADFSLFHRTEISTGHRFLYVGRLINLKNIFSLINAFASMRAPVDSLTIVGDGPLLSSLKELTSELGLENAIHFMGHHDQLQVAQDYANADTLVLPSTNEVWGLVVNEALASGIHVVVSSAAGVSEFVKPMKGAYVCEPTDIDLALALTQSRSDWEGPIPNPEIVEYTPERFAEALLGLVREIRLNL